MSLLIYLLKTLAIQVIAYLGYRWLLDREPWGQLKRAYLLISLGLSFLIPFIPAGQLLLTSAALEQLPLLLSGQEVTVVTIAQEPTAAGGGVSAWLFPLATVYLLGVIFFLGRLLRFLLGVRQRLARAESISAGPVRLVALPGPVATHTFWRWVFHEARALPAPEILAHERAHARQLHSLDRLLVALLRAFCWFNPMLYWYDLAIRENHEYLADQSVLRAGWDRTNYQQQLLAALQAINGVPPFSSGAGFTLTKKRFQMMYTTSSHWSRGLVKLSTATLLWAALLFGFGERGLAQVAPPPPPTKAAPAPPAPQPGQRARRQRVQKIPTQQQLDDWTAAGFEIMIDHQRVETTSLAGRKPTDFSHYYRTSHRSDAGKIIDVIILFTTENYPWPNVPPPPPPPPAVAPPPPPVAPPPPAVAPPPPPTAAPPPPPVAPEAIDWKTIAPRVPTATQWKSWQQPAEYGVWIDGKRVANGKLSAYSPDDFSFYTISKLERNAVNYGKHTYQINLMTNERFSQLRNRQ